ncbi:MAG TPA: hypothetical protein VGE07_15105 [Herpetosiphonaceae bacterium]
MAIVVEAASVPGQRLVAWVAHGTIITPRLVQAVIGWALQRDWQPQRRGPTRILHLEPATLAELHPAHAQDRQPPAPGDAALQTPAAAGEAMETPYVD